MRWGGFLGACNGVGAVERPPRCSKAVWQVANRLSRFLKTSFEPTVVRSGIAHNRSLSCRPPLGKGTGSCRSELWDRWTNRLDKRTVSSGQLSERAGQRLRIALLKHGKIFEVVELWHCIENLEFPIFYFRLESPAWKIAYAKPSDCQCSEYPNAVTNVDTLCNCILLIEPRTKHFVEVGLMGHGQ
jgi:hypothetical protein